jgi:hypothetical protein
VNNDFRDLLSEFCVRGVEFLVVGAHALASHGHIRATQDIDLWVNPEVENARRVRTALAAYGAPIADVTVEDLATPGLVIQVGVAPNRVDILTSISGVDFTDAWKARKEALLEGVRVPVLSKADLMKNKEASGRPKDLLDLDWLRSNKE